MSTNNPPQALASDHASPLASRSSNEAGPTSMLSSVAPWDAVAAGYASKAVQISRAFCEAALEIIPAGEGDNIADIACGPGTLSLLAAARGAQITAADFSLNMIEQLEKNVAVRNLANIRAVHCDGQDLPFDDDAFDAAFSMFGLMFFPDRAKGYAQMLRILKRGARGCVSSWAPVAASPLIGAMWSSLRHVKPDLPEPTYDAASLENPDVLRKEMTDAGFRSVEIYSVRKTTRYASATSFWSDMSKASAPIAMLKAATTPDAWREKSDRAIRFLEETVGPFPTTLAATAHLGVGQK
ncbi:MAG: methyltransferase domain-containing protein [Pseudomonadota bacterium]